VELMLPLPSMPTGLNFVEQPIANFLSLLTNNNTYGFAIGVVYWSVYPMNKLIEQIALLPQRQRWCSG
jgi:hypothetical protein